MATPRCLITAGPTREYFDPVRFLSNPSTGKMGFALAEAAVALGWDVDLVAGPTSLPEPEGLVFYPVESAAEMQAHCEGLFPPCDILIMCAAVSDYRPAIRSVQKLKKMDDSWTVTLEPVPDIVAGLSQLKEPGQIICGFAAETENVEENALRKLEAKNLDWIFANDVSQPGQGFAAEENRGIMLGQDGQRIALGPLSKAALARELLRIIHPEE
jgi:phosphopantothenoylcysteine decarboxylase/phosphopantothenate--cysteine ligase